MLIKMMFCHIDHGAVWVISSTAPPSEQFGSPAFCSPPPGQSGSSAQLFFQCSGRLGPHSRVPRTPWFFSSCGGILELRRGSQPSPWVGPGKPNLPLGLRGKAGGGARVQSHRRKPTRPRSPWGSLGKNTGVGCHFLLPCIHRIPRLSEAPREVP